MSRSRLMLPWIVATVFVLFAVEGRGAEDAAVAAEEALLKEHKIAVDRTAILAFLKARTLTAEDEKLIPRLVRQLGSESFEARETAAEQLTVRGPAVLKYLREAAKDPDLEIRRRAEMCIAAVESASGKALPVAAIHTLVRKTSEGNAGTDIEGLIEFLPHANDPYVEEEAFRALAALSAKSDKVPIALTAALRSSVPLKRAAAVYVLAQRSNIPVTEIPDILKVEKDFQVKLWGAEGLLLAKNKAGVPFLMDLLVEAPPETTRKAEEWLWRLAAEKRPTHPGGERTGDAQKQYRERWLTWWRENEEKIDLVKTLERPPFFNLTLVPELHKGRVFECDATGTILWEVGNLAYPIDSQVLPGNRVLVAEMNANKVTERDFKGNVLWELAVNHPIICERLPNGNTFAGSNHEVFEFDTEKKQVFHYKPEGGYFIHSMQRQKNGNVVMISMAGEVREVDPKGKVVTSVKAGDGGSWCGIESVPGNRYLAVNLTPGEVKEIDANGKVHWEFRTNGVSYATRLPNGNTLISSHSEKRIIEVDSKGSVVWEKKLDSSPWRVHRR